MKIKSVNLETVIGITSKLPENTLPEFAFAGKSNVGKSSLINAIMNRKSYARTSAQPGKTQTINFYNINEEFYLVDLPGYGYAKVSQETKRSQQLKAVFLLIDIRHDPSANDKDMYEWIVHNGFEPIIIATKSDKISRGQIDKHLKAIRTGLKTRPGTVMIPFSSLNKNGLDKVYEILDGFLMPETDAEDVSDADGE